MQQLESQNPTALAPADPLGAKFCKYFYHPWHWIFAMVPAAGKPQWETITRYPLQPRNLWQEYQNPTTLIGLRFGSETRYCLIDLDKGSPYHPDNPAGFNLVLAALEKIGLSKALLIQSSCSGGVHLYYFLPEPVPTFALACALKFALEDVGLHLRQGELEIFPNVKAYSKSTPSNYNAHRLPLQDGSLLIGKTLEARTNDLEFFLNLADRAAAAQNWGILNEAIAAAQKRRKLKFVPGTSSKAQEWKRHLEDRIAQGWTGSKQTNELLKDFATYGIVWEALDGEALINFLVVTATTAPGYQEWCGHKHEIRDRAQHWAQCCQGFYSPYRSYPNRADHNYKENFDHPASVVDFPMERMNRANVDRSEQAQRRIKQAVAQLEKMPAGVEARAKAIISATKASGRGISRSTLQKYPHLWHPAHESLESAQGAELQATLLPNQFPESLESAQGAELQATSIYEGSNGVSGAAAPQSQAAASTPLENRGGSPRGGAVPLEIAPARQEPSVAPTAPTAPDAPTAPTASEELIALRRLTLIKLKAVAHAQRVVREQAILEGRLFSWQEREKREAIAKMRFYWDSGESILRAEAQEWVIANPDALPEAIPTEWAIVNPDDLPEALPNMSD